MSQRAFTARLEISSDEQRSALWRTHRIFNERLCWVLRQMHRMRRGDPDPRYAELFNTFKTINDASARMEAVTSLDWKTGKTDAWCKLARELIDEGKLLFDRKRDLPGLCHHRFHRRLFEAAFQMIHGHNELAANWKKEHDKWLKAREKWERENPEYMAIRPVLEKFEVEHGQAAKRRLRWHKWLSFLRSSTDLAAWRGGPAIIEELDNEANKRIESTRPNKRNKAESDEFFKINPELMALDRLHGEYQREYVRPWAKRRNQDGFIHRPTFTEPSAERHPFWYQLMKGQAYKALCLETCSLQIRLFVSDEPNPIGKWMSFNFRPDSRLRNVRKSSNVVKDGTKIYSQTYTDSAMGIDRPAEIRGAKLIFRPARPEGNAYLYFTLDVPDLPCRIKTKQEWCDKYGTEKLCNKICVELGGVPPVTCAVDLGIRHLAAATIRREGKIVRARMIREDDRPNVGPRLPAIAAHKRKLAEKRSQRGKPIKGEDSCIELQKHVLDMGKDRLKKGARRIVNFAYQNGCDLIVMERLAGLIPDAEKERGINRALMNWNRGQLVQWVKQLAADAGMRVVEVHPSGTSQICSKCGSLGARFSADHGQAKIEVVGKLFACPDCGYTANADHNASVNLHKRFFGELPFFKKIRDGVYRLTNPDGSTVDVERKQIETRLAPRLFRICSDKSTPF